MPTNFFKIKFQNILKLQFLLLIIAIIYLIIYISDERTPGFFTDYKGWWGWSDQGEYLKSANALSQFNLDPNFHFYPPLYPALGAIFLPFSSQHPFFLINLIFLLWFSFVFIRFSDLYISRWASATILAVSVVFNFTIFQNFVIPWTTTLGAALLSTGILGLIWLQELVNEKRLQITKLQIFTVTLCLSLIIPTRPVDAPAGFIVGLAFVIAYFGAHLAFVDKVPSPKVFLTLTMLAAVTGPIIFLGYNQIVFGNPFGSYLNVAGGNGFFPANSLQKFISIWLDSKTLYGESKANLTHKFPWLFIALAGYVWVIFYGNYLLRVIALAIGVMFMFYLPYGDLLPNGVFRFMNIHYFKWAFPYLALFGWLLIQDLIIKIKMRNGWLTPLLILFLIAALMMSLQLKLKAKPIAAETSPTQSIIFTGLPENQIDYIDIKGITGGFGEIYFGNHKLLLDDYPLALVRDFRLIPQDASVRLIFSRPVKSSTIEFIPDSKMKFDQPEILAMAGTYKITLGKLKPFRRPKDIQFLPYIAPE